MHWIACEALRHVLICDPAIHKTFKKIQYIKNLSNYHHKNPNAPKIINKTTRHTKSIPIKPEKKKFTWKKKKIDQFRLDTLVFNELSLNWFCFSFCFIWDILLTVVTQLVYIFNGFVILISMIFLLCFNFIFLQSKNKKYFTSLL